MNRNDIIRIYSEDGVKWINGLNMKVHSLYGWVTNSCQFES